MIYIFYKTPNKFPVGKNKDIVAYNYQYIEFTPLDFAI